MVTFSLGSLTFNMFSDKDIARFRAETDGVQKVIHFNNAGASLPSNIVRDTVIDFLSEEATIGGYEIQMKRAGELDATYDSVAGLINAQSKEIAIVENATAAWNAAFQAIDWQEGDEIICNRPDYASNYLAYLHHPKKPVIKVIPNNEHGDEDLEAFEKLFSAKTKLVSITHMPTNSGHLAPAEQIGKICKSKGVLYLLDACQSVGQYPIDVEKIQCDMLSATGRKYLRAPRGTGFLYVRESVLPKLTPYTVDLHSATWTGEQTYEIRKDARKFENWEGNRANQLGLKVAADYAYEAGLENIWQRVQELATQLRDGLRKMDHIHLQDQGTELGGIVSFTVDGMAAPDVMFWLLDRGINLSWNGEPNTYLDMTAKGLKEIVRACVHYYNTEEEVSLFLKTIDELRS
ncbi:MAG: aminotransferase [Roseivirga sp. XM-24bin3]|nr:MAG: aminotransferase [Roseivirga sp. XM-24bin3]